MDVRALGYVGVSARDPQTWASWGPQVMGFGIGDPNPAVSAVTTATTDDDGSVFLRMDDRRWRLAVHPGDTDGDLCYVGWELADRTAFAEALDELKNMNIEFEVADETTAFSRGVQGMAWFLDPAGFRHEIFWSAYYFEDSFVPGRRLKEGWRTGSLGIGHIVLMVPELTEELDQFATNVLGMRVFAGGTSIPVTGGDGGRLRTEMYRGRRNKRTHNLVYMEKPGYKGLHHLFVEYNSLDDMGKAYDLVQRSEYPLVMTIGRHQADTFLSFYTQTPSKFLFEVAWNSMLIDDEDFVQDRPLHSFVWGLDMVGDVVPAHLKLSG